MRKGAIMQFIENYSNQISGVLHCYDRIVIQGTIPGLVHILSAMEACPSYKPWHNKNTGKTYLKSVQGKCLHYYFYFIDEDLGLCYVRVPTWCPFRLQIYFNGHNVLNAAMNKKDIQNVMLDNAILKTDSFDLAQKFRMGSTSIKMYDKHGIILRIETTTNDISFFKHYRKIDFPFLCSFMPSRTESTKGRVNRIPISGLLSSCFILRCVREDMWVYKKLRQKVTVGGVSMFVVAMSNLSLRPCRL
jgi:hypothetical protein